MLDRTTARCVGTARARRWILGVLPGVLNSTANAISGNGTTVVGERNFAPFVWTQAGGGAFAVNFDGSVAAGYEGPNAARWNNGVR